MRLLVTARHAHHSWRGGQVPSQPRWTSLHPSLLPTRRPDPTRASRPPYPSRSPTPSRTRILFPTPTPAPTPTDPPQLRWKCVPQIGPFTHHHCQMWCRGRGMTFVYTTGVRCSCCSQVWVYWSRDRSVAPQRGTGEPIEGNVECRQLKLEMWAALTAAGPGPSQPHDHPRKRCLALY
jgi:hypothetical protein